MTAPPAGDARDAAPSRILFVTGMSGAGKSTALNTLEDMGWEVVDNLPLPLVDRLLQTEAPAGRADAHPLAIGIDSRTRGFDAGAAMARVATMREGGAPVAILFLDCGDAELERRYSETRRRHPLALDRPATEGIADERALLAPVRAGADYLLDTTGLTTNGLKGELRERFGGAEAGRPTLAVTSFGFARGLPRNADLVFDLRFLRNPHWVDDLRPLTGLDAAVADYVAGDPAYADAIGRIEELLVTLLPRYAAEGKSYVTIALGCTGGRHRSVHVAERIGRRLRAAGFSPTVAHRDLGQRTAGSDGQPPNEGGSGPSQGHDGRQ